MSEIDLTTLFIAFTLRVTPVWACNLQIPEDLKRPLFSAHEANVQHHVSAGSGWKYARHGITYFTDLFIGGLLTHRVCWGLLIRWTHVYFTVIQYQSLDLAMATLIEMITQLISCRSSQLQVRTALTVSHSLSTPNPTAHYRDEW